MMSEVGKKGVEENKKLLSEIEAISKALYVDKSPYKGKVNGRSASIGSFPEPKPKSKNVGLDEEVKDKKSFWNWKPLKALSHPRNKRFNCCFSLIVHSIDGLPAGFDGASLRVHWKRKDGEMVTHCGKVVDGVAEFDQRLIHTCLVYGSRSGQHHSAKYEAKHFLLYAALFGSPELDLGKHRVDLTRLLPLTLEELEEEKSSGRWTTDFKLSGKARGATMHVSFGYSVVKDMPPTPPLNNRVAPGTISKKSSVSIARYGSKFGQETGGPSLRRTGSLPSNNERWPHGSSRSVEEIKVMHEVVNCPISVFPSVVKNSSEEIDKEILETSVDKPKFDVFTINLRPLDHSSLASDSDKENVENECKKMLAPQKLKVLLDKELDENVNVIVEANVEGKSAKNESFAWGSGNKSLRTGTDGKINSIEGVTVVDMKEEAKMQNECEKNESFSDRGTELFGKELDGLVNRLENINIVSESGTGEANVDHVTDSAKTPFLETIELKCLEEVATNQVGHQNARNEDIEDGVACSKTDILEDLQSALEIVSGLELVGFNSPEEGGQNDDFFVNDTIWKGKSISFDDETDSVASEFLNLLGVEDSSIGLSSESEPDSPRERLLRQFEKDSMADGFPLFDYSCFEENTALFEDGVSDEADADHETNDFELSSMILAAEEEYLAAIESEACKTKAKMLEDMETEALMHKWGLNEKAFVGSSSTSPHGFGCLGCVLDESSELPPLGEGLGPFIQTKDGGYVRSMRPSVFRNGKNGGSLVMQVSSLVVVPAEMGSDVMGILQGLASIGIEKLSVQAKNLMPLEDITGKTMQQIAWEASPSIKAAAEHQFVHRGKNAVTEPIGVKTSARDKDMQSEYVSLDDLAPLAMDKIEALSMEGLRTQAGMSGEAAPSNISATSIGDISALKERSADLSGTLGMEVTVGLQLVDAKDSGEDVDGLMSLSLTLDEWMRLDSGEFDNDGEDQISERTSKLLAAHHANSLEQIYSCSRGEKRKGKGSSKKCGLLGNNFTVALLVQLRDPFRNYEPVGTPMLALVQVERVFTPPKPRIFRTITEVDNSEDDEPEILAKASTRNTQEGKIGDEEGIPQYKIKEVHISGLKGESLEKKLWGSKTHQQSGSRWLVANGMGKPNKHPLLKSKDAGKLNPQTPTPTGGSSLWSISSLFWGSGSKPKESSDNSTHKRNPDIIFKSTPAKLR